MAFERPELLSPVEVCTQIFQILVHLKLAEIWEYATKFMRNALPA